MPNAKLLGSALVALFAVAGANFAPSGPGTSAVCDGSNVNPPFLSNTSTSAGAKANAPNMGDVWEATLFCVGADPSGLAIFSIRLGSKPLLVMTPFGELLIRARVGSGLNIVLPHFGRVTSLIRQLPPHLVGVPYTVQGYGGSAPGAPEHRARGDDRGLLGGARWAGGRSPLLVGSPYA
jgi:hypothetical protein